MSLKAQAAGEKVDIFSRLWTGEKDCNRWHRSKTSWQTLSSSFLLV